MLVFVSNTFAQSNALVRLSFPPVQSLAVGELLTFRLTITDGENITAYQATVSYDTSALRYVSSQNGDYLPAGAFFVPSIVFRNTVSLAAISLAGESNGDGTLATLTFEVVAVKASTLRSSNVLLINRDGQIYRPQVETIQITESGPSSDPIGLTLPPDLISEVAYGPNSTYFIVTGQFPTLTGVNDPADVIYRKGITMIDLPDDTQHFWFPLEEREIDAGLAELGVDITVVLVGAKAGCEVGAVIGGAVGALGAVVGAGPGAIIGCVIGGVAAPLIYTVSKHFWKVHEEKKEAEKLLGNPVIELKSDKGTPGLPRDTFRILVLIQRRVSNIKVGMGLEYQLNSEKRRFAPDPIYSLMYEGTWNLAASAAAAPGAQPMSLADYPSFQQLSPEAQEYFLRHFGAANAEAWQIPEQTSLLSNYPNPFNPETWIPYQLATSADVTLIIYDIKGRVVRDIDLGHQRAGICQSKSRAAYWDGRNAQGEPVASGVYFYTLTAGDFTATRKMLIRK